MQRICVFCGSNPGRNPEYADAARQLAATLVGRNIGVVYGGASVGVMGALADAALDLDGEVIGIIPNHLMNKERVHQGLTDLHIVESMHERKALMGSLSDGFVALPGGLGTLEELFEVMTWNQLGIHNKPCGLLNTAGFYDALAAFIDHTVREKFVSDKHRSFFVIDGDPVTLVDGLARTAAGMKSADGVPHGG